MSKALLMSTLGKLVGNRPTQRLLEFTLRVNLWLMGIGAGAAPESSGESVLPRMIRRHAQGRPMCILDVGANAGQFATMMIGALEGCDVTLHCFEPARETFAALTARLGSDPRVRLNKMALGAQKGELPLFYDEPGSHIASLHKRRLDFRDIEFDKSETVPVDTLDAYCSANVPGPIDLLKLDVEGHELEVLRGALGTLPRVKMVSFEFGGSNIDSRTYLQDFHYFFKEHGFGLLRITPSGFLVPVKYMEHMEQFSTTNYVAVRP